MASVSDSNKDAELRELRKENKGLQEQVEYLRGQLKEVIDDYNERLRQAHQKRADQLDRTQFCCECDVGLQ